MVNGPWGNNRKNTWALVDDKLDHLNRIREELSCVLSGEIPMTGDTSEGVMEAVSRQAKRLRQDMFREAVALVDLLKIYHAFEDE